MVKFYSYLITFLLIPVFFSLALWYAFGFDSVSDGFVYAYDIAKDIYTVGDLKGIRIEIWLSFVIAILPFLSVYYFFFRINRTSHGKAKWAKVSDIVKMGLNFKNGFILGLTNDLSKRKVFYDKPLASLIVAPPGSGKSASIVIPNLLTIPSSCIVTDIKGELCDATAGYRSQKLKNEILIFNPYGDDNNCFFNPFAFSVVKDLDFNQKKMLVDEVANAIYPDNPQEKDAHWRLRAKEFFRFLALYDLCTKGYTTLYDIAIGASRDFSTLIPLHSPYHQEAFEYEEKNVGMEDYVNEKGETEQRKVKKKVPVKNEFGNYVENDVNLFEIFLRQVSKQRYCDPNNPNNWRSQTEEEINKELENGQELLDNLVKSLALSFKAGDEFNSVLSTFSNGMSVFRDNQIKSVTTAMSFNYEDFREKNITLYIKIPQSQIETLAPLVRIIVESISKNLLNKESKKPEERVYFLMDEFVRFGKMPFLLELPALCRSYGVVPLFVTQSYAQIKKYYSEDDLKILSEIVGYKIIFRMNGEESAEQLSKEIGNFTRETRSTSTRENVLIFGGNQTRGLEGYRLVTAQDILNLQDDEVIILATGQKALPLKLKANLFFKSKELLKKMECKYNPKQEKRTSDPIEKEKSLIRLHEEERARLLQPIIEETQKKDEKKQEEQAKTEQEEAKKKAKEKQEREIASKKAFQEMDSDMDSIRI